ncbi:MAG: hypothetical protein ACE5F7_03120 [Nitrospiria bacterium]
MNTFFSSTHFPSASSEEDLQLAKQLGQVLEKDFKESYFTMLARYQRILADLDQRGRWPEIHDKLNILFQCGKAVPLDGPMIGIPVSIRDTDYFKDAAKLFGNTRSRAAGIETMATAWNATFADTGIWMGKTYEPVSRETVAEKCGNDPDVMQAYNPETTRIGRNFFREPHDPNVVQAVGLPALNTLWRLQDRPLSVNDKGFEGMLLEGNLKKEKSIPYTKTGGIFLANMGHSVVPEMNGKSVYQLNYRWRNLNPPFPMTRLIDEIVQIADGLYLGQLVFASRHYNLGTLDLPLTPEERHLTLGEPYAPREKPNWWDRFLAWLTGKPHTKYVDYGYQNNGFFLMMDPAFATQIYADNAFPQLRPRSGERGYVEPGYTQDSDAATEKMSRAATSASGGKT